MAFILGYILIGVFLVLTVIFIVQLVRSLLPFGSGYKKLPFREQSDRLDLAIGRFLWAIGWLIGMKIVGIAFSVVNYYIQSQYR